MAESDPVEITACAPVAGSIEDRINELGTIINNLNEEIERSQERLAPILSEISETAARLRLTLMNNRIEL